MAYRVELQSLLPHPHVAARRGSDEQMVRINGVNRLADCLNPTVPAPANIYVMPLRFKLGGRPVLSARFNVETARSQRKRPEI
jgi:hypothetical protein